MSRFGCNSVEVSPPPPSSSEGGVRRLATTKDKLITTPFQGVTTLPALVEYARKTHGDENAMGWREVHSTHEKEVKADDGKSKKWTLYHLGSYQYLSYVQFEEAIREAAVGLMECGVKTGEVLDVFAETSPNWQIVTHACALISTTVATAYDTLGESGLQHSLNEPECVGVYTNAHLLPLLARVLPNTPSVRLVLYDGKPDEEVLKSVQGTRTDGTLRVLHIDELRNLGRQSSISSSDFREREPKPDTLAYIMYTSGSMGNPKGVTLTHANLISAVGAMHTVFEPHIPRGSRFVAYLPLAHVLENVVELCALFSGVVIGYGRNKTLTDRSVCGPGGEGRGKGDLSEFKPHILFGVPAVWETMRKGIQVEIAKGGSLTQTIFNAAIGVKRWVGPYFPPAAWAVDWMVFSKAREAVGGELKFAVNGGAAVSRDTQEWFNLVVGPLTQGYGLTETCGMCAFLPPDIADIGNVGVPAPCIEIKLLDCPDMGYDSQPESSTPPQGEILIRGESVTKGYFKRDDLNKDSNVFTGDGWFRTGDVGQWNTDGTLSVIDRLKNLVKLLGGEYIALERLESIYKSSNLITDICLHATSDMQAPIAIVVVPRTKDGKSAEENQKAIIQSFKSLAQQNKLGKMEIPSAVLISKDGEWTAENGMVTAAGKVNRKKILESVKDDIAKL